MNSQEILLMPKIQLTNDLKAQLIGWLNREKDHLLSIKAMAERIIIPGVTGSLNLIQADLDYVVRLRRLLREHDLEIDLSPEDTETLVDIAVANQYENRRGFWGAVKEAIT